jgi:SP family myo-inositol transporter-like MFS transporter 13
MYYSASIFATLGYRNGTAVGLLIAIVNFLFTLLALRVGTILSSAHEYWLIW